MAIFHVATNTPSKSDLITPWLREQPWTPGDFTEVELVGGFHLDDPDGEVGMQVFAVKVGSALVHVPLTYRAEPLAHAGGALIGTMQHSTLGIRYVYDGLGDDQFIAVLAGVAACGYGQAVGFAEHEGRHYAWPEKGRVHGFGAIEGRVPVDNFVIASTTDTSLTLRNDGIEMTVFRQLTDRPTPAIGLAATWPGQTTPLALVGVTEI